MDLEVDVNSHQASPFVDIYQAEVMFPLNFNTVKSGWGGLCIPPKH